MKEFYISRQTTFDYHARGTVVLRDIYGRDHDLAVYRHVYMDVDRRTGVICIRVKRKEGNIYKVADQLDQRPAERIIKMLDATWLLRSNIGADVGANVFDMKFWVAHFDENEGTDPVDESHEAGVKHISHALFYMDRMLEDEDGLDYRRSEYVRQYLIDGLRLIDKKEG